jgi:hypothetical protein
MDLLHEVEERRDTVKNLQSDINESFFKRLASETKNLRTEKNVDNLDKQKTLRQAYRESAVMKDFFHKNFYKGSGKFVHKENYLKILTDSFDDVSPLIYLSPEQRKAVINSIHFVHFGEKSTLYTGSENNKETDTWGAFILIQGELHIFDHKNNFQDIINQVTFFGYDGPIFNKRFNTVIVEKDTTLGMISEKDFLEIITPFSKFSTYISRNIIHKDKVLDPLTKIKNMILQHGENYIDIDKLLNNYRQIDSCLHPKCNTDVIDFSAWTYSLNRLPDNIFETFVFILLNKPSKILFSRDDVVKEITPRIHTTSRNRDVFRYMDGKNVIVVREMETDVLDFISNICIHIIEAHKIRKLISSPKTLNLIYDTRGNFNQTISVLRNEIGIEINDFAEHTVKKIFGDSFSDKLISLCLHYQDYSISIKKISISDQDPVEKWVQNLWRVAKKLLGVNSTVDEIDDLVVDIFQGSKRTLMGCISPHLFKHKEEILKWASENGIQLKTKVFLNESDKLLAYSYYYYKAFPEKSLEREEMDKKHGIKIIEQTFSTGIQVLLINTNKLDPRYVDPYIKLKPASKNHIILHIGYTFGAQSGHIIKPLLMLFGSKARSMNIIGKAGGLTGSRTDILVANKVFYDKTHEIANLNYGNLDISDLENATKSTIHLGPMLTVAGTILQNYDLLHFYKKVMGCVGLEMEGYFFVKEIENSIKHNLLKNDFITRCFYYASDIPLDPTQNLAQEDGNVSWDEGVGSMNAIQRYILKQVISE